MYAKLYTFHEELRALNERAHYSTKPAASNNNSNYRQQLSTYSSSSFSAYNEEPIIRYSANDFYDEEEEYNDEEYAEYEQYQQYDQDYYDKEGLHYDDEDEDEQQNQ